MNARLKANPSSSARGVYSCAKLTALAPHIRNTSGVHLRLICSSKGSFNANMPDMRLEERMKEASGTLSR